MITEKSENNMLTVIDSRGNTLKIEHVIQHRIHFIYQTSN